MPRIQIAEKDYTSAGASNDYSNYGVLVVGFADKKTTKTGTTAKTGTFDIEEEKKTNPNLVYEFSEKQKFLDTIGECEPEIKKETSAGSITNYHYGNLMARKLLDLGYPIVYKVITDITDLNKEVTWDIFKDKVNYDFRFITHGLLNKSLSPEIENPENEEGDDELEPVPGETTTTTEPTTTTTTTTTTINETFINTVNGIIAKIAGYADNDGSQLTGRGDCVALLELTEECYTELPEGKTVEEAIIDGINTMSTTAGFGDNGAGKYCALTVPSVTYADGTKMPAAFHYLACFMASLQKGFKEWYAAAGYTRGVCGQIIDHTTVKLGEIAINALEPRNKVTSDTTTTPSFACNVIAYFRGSYYLWGNRTAAALEDANGTEGDLKASHFLNIRQLCTTIKKQLYVACRRYTFDPNSETLWVNFKNAIAPTLDNMKADQGIRDYKIVKIADTKKAMLTAKIRIIPIEAVEDFDLEISLEDSFGETTAVVTE